jgi:superfamily II DNA or RNA helicase
MHCPPDLACLELRMTPHGRLLAESAADAARLDAELARRLSDAFARGSGHGLLRLGAGEVGRALPPVFTWWRGFAARYVAALCLHPPGGGNGANAILPAVAAPTAAELASFVLTAPIMPGSEYITADVLSTLWSEIETVCAAAYTASGTDLQSFLKGLNPAWNLVGRVHFNLAENRRDEDAPFAFMATYTTRLSAQAKAQHVPLGQALREYAAPSHREKLLALLLPVQRAAERCTWLKPMIDSGEIFHPLRWTPREAAQLLGSAPDLESAGVVLRMPPSWRAARPPRPKVTGTVGSRAPAAMGLDGLLDFRMEVTLDGGVLTEQEIAILLAGTESLVLLRGKWVEVDRDRLERAMHQFREAEALAAQNRLSFAEAMRMVAGAAVTGELEEVGAREWAGVTAGPWLMETLRAMRAPDAAVADPGPALHATLRPYQKVGVQWLRLLSGLRLGACLADDMGLGKTIQVLALLLLERQGSPAPARSGASGMASDLRLAPSLLVAPASLLANWSGEIERFAPELRTLVLHPSEVPAAEIKAFSPAAAYGLDLVITSYASLLRIPALAETAWRFVILDEAQAIKNPGAKQTRAAKSLSAQARIALTGTPVENHLGDLWSIFDFINPGLLGSARQFTGYVKAMAERTETPYGPLRELVRPYLLRRMKTDKAIIADLPDKTEVTAHCNLTRRQAALYQQAVHELEKALENSEGIERKGLVLAMMMRFKQICNHPSHWLGDNDWAEDDSGKFARLREIGEVVTARQEKVLVFTQFREMCGPLSDFLGHVFGRPGVVLHGETAVRRRRELVRRFQEDELVPFFVLSLKAGGAGLTLTAASHVVHFDRWWNPAVENQATDRAFRIGQRKNVLVHKFVCRGTMEERIDRLIDSKRAVSDQLLASGGEINLTELKDDELLGLVALDLNAAMKD